MAKMIEMFSNKFTRLRKFFIEIILYLKYPDKIKLGLRTFITRPKANKLGIVSHEPNYIFMDWFDSSSTIVDVGCGYEADFSMSMIARYHLKALAVDPTHKHVPYLQDIKRNADGHFKHLALAIAPQNGKIVFNESVINESGSMLADHVNIQQGEIRSYEVESVNLKGLIKKIEVNKIDLIKLDIEGAEYDLLRNVSEEDLKPFRQIFIEFHHRTVPQYSRRDTKEIVKHICSRGFDVFTADGRNYLFYNKDMKSKA